LIILLGGNHDQMGRNIVRRQIEATLEQKGGIVVLDIN